MQSARETGHDWRCYSGFWPWDSGSSSSYKMLSHVCSPEHLLLQLTPASLHYAQGISSVVDRLSVVTPANYSICGKVQFSSLEHDFFDKLSAAVR